MSGIARVLLASGIDVSGSDAKDSRRLAALRALGAHVRVGHDPAALGDTDGLAVVISTAIPQANAEVVAARSLGVPVFSRAAALAAIMRGHRTIAVSGTHGKTTTTSMMTVALQACGADPSFVIGSEIHESGSNAHLGSGDIFVVEADESDGSFLRLSPVAGIVTNVEADHLNHWGTFEAVERGFDDFVADICGRGGFVVVCADDDGSRRMGERARGHGFDVRTYGFSDDADFRVASTEPDGRGWTFSVVHRGVRLGAVTLTVPGRHNVLNATAALAVGLGMGFPFADLVRGLQGFSGTRRRFELKGQADGVRVYDDYAHHPTEIAATLTAARDVAGSGQVVVAFQAHHYYRTAMFVKEFGEALGLADQVVVLEVFAPGEEAIPGASGQTMAANVPLPAAQVVFEPSWSAVAAHLADRARSGDIVMTLGAGDIGMIAGEVLELLAVRESAE